MDMTQDWGDLEGKMRKLLFTNFTGSKIIYVNTKLTRETFVFKLCHRKVHYS